MSEYNFSKLSPRDFESLSQDILSNLEKKRVERFRSGRDGGIDGRFYSSEGDKTIIQCKHYEKSGFDQLKYNLINTELKKIQKINPSRYIITTTVELSPSQKDQIIKALKPYIKRSDDIIGKTEIIDFLRNNPKIESNHYKLWMHSTNVLKQVINNDVEGKSRDKLIDIKDSLSIYYRTSNYNKAIEKLEKAKYLIITGEPGIGKTTLAYQLLWNYISLPNPENFTFYYIEDVCEGNRVFDETDNQIFLFDDFLGENILEVFRGREESNIVQFVNRIKKDSKKRLILTSRTVILNRAKNSGDRFVNNGMNQNEFEIRIESLSMIDKAYILYNHIWNSSITKDYEDEIYKDKRYKEIINHPNYSPRLISFITSPNKLANINSSEYWGYIINTLKNPKDIWRDIFYNQITDFERFIIYLTTFNGGGIKEQDLKTSFGNLMLENKLTTEIEFENKFKSAIKVVSLSLLKTSNFNGNISYSLSNPSIGDYIILNNIRDIRLVTSCFKKLNSTNSLDYLDSLYNQYDELKMDIGSKSNPWFEVKNDLYNQVLEAIVIEKLNSTDPDIDIDYKMKLAILVQNRVDYSGEVIQKKNCILRKELKEFIEFLIKQKPTHYLVKEFSLLYTWYIEKDLIGANSDCVSSVLNSFINMDLDFEDMSYLKPLVGWVDDLTENDLYSEQLQEKFIQYFITNNDVEISESNVLDDIYCYDHGWEILSKFINDRSSELGFHLSEYEVSEILENVDLDPFIEANRYSEDKNELDYNAWKENGFEYKKVSSAIDEVDDIFYRDK